MNQQITYDSLINIRPRQNKRVMEIQNATIEEWLERVLEMSVRESESITA